MIRYYAKKDGILEELSAVTSSCWININKPFNFEELEELSSRYAIPIDFLTDSLDIDERSRYEREDDARLIVVNTPIMNDGIQDNDAGFVTVPIGVILTQDLIITITAYDNPVLDLFLENKVKNFDPSNRSKFVMQLFEQNVYRYLTCLKNLNISRNIIEKELYDSSKNNDLRRLLSIEKSLVFFVNSLSSNELLKMKIKRTDFLKIRGDEDLEDLFEDIIIDNSQALEMANVHTNILSGTMEAYSSIISNNLNQGIQRLTLITIILMVTTLVASFYGMNVELPFKDVPGAFYYILVFSLIISGLLAWFFKSRRLF